MALFSRRTPRDPKPDPQPESEAQAATTDAAPADAASPAAAASAAPEAPEAPDTSDETPEAQTASVDISVSSFRGLGAAHAPGPAAPPPAQTAAPRPAASAGAAAAGDASGSESPAAPAEAIPGLRDNVYVRDALAAMPAKPEAADVLAVVRQLLQGHLFLRVKGDARSLLSEGKPLPLATGSVNGKSYALAFSGGAALKDAVREDGDTATSAMAQPVQTVIRHALTGDFDGLMLDASSRPASAIVPREVLQSLMDQADPELTIKSLLAGERTPATAAAVVDALSRAPFWVAVNEGPDGRLGVAEGRTSDGVRLLELFSHPVEVAAAGRKDRPAPMTAAQLAKALRGDEQLGGVVIDARGPWIRLSRDDLAPLIDAA
ncbi:hypothetical protein GCM10022200_13990 [Microbacterium awajiense]|uniref:SseB protein N-terminal domain-containing protein n=1 Tax=Microbacterium awajiense TaxID=415214 RepID=A0ABP7AGW0_9MICO